MGKILAVGADLALLHTRGLVLEQTGAELYGAQMEPALALLQAEFFDVVVLCHTLSEQDTLRVCTLVELFWPLTRLIFIGELGVRYRSASRLDAAFPWRLGPGALIELTRSMLCDVSPLLGKRAVVVDTAAEPPVTQPLPTFRSRIRIGARAAGATQKASSLLAATPALGHSGGLHLA